MALNLKNSINWTLALPVQDSREYLMMDFDQSIFRSDKEFGMTGTDLLCLMQETYYVTSLDIIDPPELPILNNQIPHKDDSNYETPVTPVDFEVYRYTDPNKKLSLDQIDEAWNTIIGFFGQLYNKISGKYDLLSDDATTENTETLFHLKGVAYKKYINTQLGNVYALRYEVFGILSKLIPGSLLNNNTVKLCTNIICDGMAFQRFFNASLGWIEKTLKNIQIYEGKKLDKLIRYLALRYGSSKFRQKYASGNGCFSKTLTFDGQEYTNVLCFSGINTPSPSIQNSINRIAGCGLFGKHYVVMISPKVRYYISQTKFITLGDAVGSGLFNSKNKLDGRMFSCCERKTFADYDWSKCQWFRMVVRYTPCELCKVEVGMFENKFKYPSRVIGGYPLDPLENLPAMNKLANEIHQKMYPLLLPWYPNLTATHYP